MALNANANETSTFTARFGEYAFPDLTPTNRALSQVNNWHAGVWKRQIVGWEIEQEGSDNQPTWIVLPIIMGERHPQYRGSGTSKKKAKEDSALRIRDSGHC
ncbi:unnamed protein product [Rhizoctonia solani]|uniref:Uncharacterized protein n=1 Tax=Rhizoctonia solani TaxID=456999 RepID=A0A8H3CQZ9_9AGAM|nr:unnamed protein product [Rhizoctonia solani]